jgi:single-strand DNA-binding protein
MNYNKSVIVGRVTQPPQLRSTPSGQSVLSMSVATNRVWTYKQGTKQEAVEFHNVVIWGKTAEVASTFLEKGSLVLVEGRLETRSWQDKEGVTRKSTEIIADGIQFGPRSGDKSPAAAKVAAPLLDESPERVIRLDEDEEESGRHLTAAFSDDEEIKPEDIPF